MIQFDQVTKAFGDKVVLDCFSTKIEIGKINFVIGKSGEGKSVAVKHIIGIMQPTSGKVIVEDTDIGTYSPKELLLYRRKFGMLFQHAALFDSLSVEDNILFPLDEQTDLDKSQKTERIDAVLEEVGLSGCHKKFPAELSTGEKKRVGLARAIAAKPSYLIYDEPTTGMDPIVSEMIDELIVSINKHQKQLTSIVISHDLKAALKTADNIIMIYQGRAILEGSPDEFRKSKDPVVRQFFAGKTEGPMKFF